MLSSSQKNFLLIDPFPNRRTLHLVLICISYILHCSIYKVHNFSPSRCPAFVLSVGALRESLLIIAFRFPFVNPFFSKIERFFGVFSKAGFCCHGGRMSRSSLKGRSGSFGIGASLFRDLPDLRRPASPCRCGGSECKRKHASGNRQRWP